MSSVISAGFICVVLAALYVRHKIIQPSQVIGSYLEDTPYRTRKMIRDVKQQHYREMWNRADPD